ncbi:MAG: tetratricopeptide repeat protein [Desulfobacteraceae bacterium]|nr:tetratricopeptide repeat protein [Desulfobacteraceae bacterium]MBC2758191.1 tetratricopeptide repeat protein [Desulfobacteraceae bacterium]
MSIYYHVRKYGNILKQSVLVILMLLACLMIYSNTIHSPFAFDDHPFIIKDSHIHISTLSFKNLAHAAFSGKPRQRPFSNISFAINYYFGNDNPAGYHITNIFIHFFSGLFLFYLIRHTILLSAPVFAGSTLQAGQQDSFVFKPENIAFMATLIWFVHPLHSESVTYICQRMTSLAGMFYVLSLWLYVKGKLSTGIPDKINHKRIIFFGGCVVSGGLAVLSKPNAATLPVMILLYEWFFFKDLRFDWLKRRFIWIAVVICLVCVFSIMFLGNSPVDRILSAYTRRDFTLSQRMLTEFRVVIYYISLIFYPHFKRLNLDYNYPLSDSFITPLTTFPALLSILGLIGMVVYSARKEPFLGFGILWFLVTLVIESSVIGLEIIFEHRTYLPSMFLIPAVVILFYRNIRPQWVVIVALCLLIFFGAYGTFQRNAVWQDEIRLWEDCVQKSPEKSRPHYNLGCVLVKRNLFDKTITHFSKAAQLNPGHSDTHYNLGYAMAQKELYGPAIDQFFKALVLDPDYAEAHNNLANALSKIGRSDSALKHYREAVRLESDNAYFHTNLGKELFAQNLIDEAISHFRRSYQLKPKNLENLNKLGYSLFSRGNVDEAMSFYRKALQLSPNNGETHGKIGDLLVEKKDFKNAIIHYIKALEINSSDAQSHYNLGIAFYKMGRLDQARKHFAIAARISPDLQAPNLMIK